MTGTRQVTYTDGRGRKMRALIPATAPDTDAEHGLILGPVCDLSILGLDARSEVALHNALEVRGVLTAEDALRWPERVREAVVATIRLDVQRVQEAFVRGAG